MPFEMDSTISIHAPREGGDSDAIEVATTYQDFNPRPPRGGRPGQYGWNTQGKGFQSTPPARGATGRHRAASPGRRISIHAPREGGDAAAVE